MMIGLGKKIGAAVAIAAALVGAAAGAHASGRAAETVLFVGNSYTFGAYSPIHYYRNDTVTDLNGQKIGGVPALFKLMAKERGHDYAVSLETAPGMGLDYHYVSKQPALDRKWDHVFLQSFSTLDKEKPGDPATLIKYAGLLSDLFTARNPNVDIRLVATWSRPDLTYTSTGHWYGQSIHQMGLDVRAGCDLAVQAVPSIHAVVPVGEAFNRAVVSGLAAANPYNGLGPNQIDLWAWDNYHASAYGYYLYALMAFGSVTGLDPQSLGAKERAALEMGFSPTQTLALEKIAHDQLAAEAQAGALKVSLRGAMAERRLRRRA